MPRHHETTPARREWARYLRVSDVRGRTGESFHSPDQQDEECLRKIAEIGGRPGPRFYDASVSGGSMDRPEFKLAWNWVMERPQDRGLVTYDFSRFGRTEDTTAWYAQLRNAGSDLVTVKDDISNTLIRGVYAAMAAHQREQIGDRWESIVRRRFERGEHHGTCPVGYRRRESGGGPLLVDPVLGPVVTEVFRRYAQGDAVGSVARYLAAAAGHKVTTRAVRNMVSLETYRGIVSLKGETRPGNHEPLVDHETWERAQARRRLAKQTPPRTEQRVHVLAGLVYCSACGRRLHVRHANGDRVLVCPGYVSRHPVTGERECAVGIGAPKLELLEEAVLHVLGEWGLVDDQAADGAELRAAIEQQATLLAEAEKRLAKVREAADNAAADYYAGDLEQARYDRVLKTLEERETREQFAVDTCRKALSDAENAAAGVLDGNQRRMIQRVLESWPTADPDHRRRIIESWISHVLVERRPAGSREPLHEYVNPIPRAVVYAMAQGADVLAATADFADEVAIRRGARAPRIRKVSDEPLTYAATNLRGTKTN